MTKQEIQKIANEVSKKYGVPNILIKTSDRKHSKGLAYYATYRYKVGGKIQKKHHPSHITIFDWDGVKATGRFPTLQVAHELAHHILNIKNNSLRHTARHDDIETQIGMFISRKLR